MGNSRQEEGERLLDNHEQRRGPPACQRMRNYIIEPMIFLYLIAGMPLRTISQQYLVSKAADSLGIDYDNLTHGNASHSCVINKSQDAYIDRETVQDLAAAWNMYQNLACFLPGFLSPLILGSLSDKLGRRLLFISPCIGSMLATAVYLAMIYFDLPLWVYIFSSIEYYFGSSGALFAGAFTYIADTTSVKTMAFRMAILDCIALFTGAIANLFVGYWIAAQGYFWPFVFVICFKFIAMLYAIFLIPETLSPVSDTTRNERKVVCNDLLSAIRLSIFDNGMGRRWKINILLLSHLSAELISTKSVRTLYMMNTPLCWQSVAIGYYQFVAFVAQGTSMLIVAFIPGRFISAEWKVLLSRASGVAENIYMFFATTSLMMYFTPLFGCLAFLALPLMRFIMLGVVEPHEKGAAFALMSTVRHSTELLSALTTNEIYQRTLYVLHGGIVFLGGAGAVGTSLLLFIIFMIGTRRERNASLVTMESKIGNIQT